MSKIIADLIRKKCVPCEGGVDPMEIGDIKLMLNGLQDWDYSQGFIHKSYKFKDHYMAVSFLNAVAWISHREDHHPNLEIGYNEVKVKYQTHAISGISENDFICAAKVDYLLDI